MQYARSVVIAAALLCAPAAEPTRAATFFAEERDGAQGEAGQGAAAGQAGAVPPETASRNGAAQEGEKEEEGEKKEEQPKAEDLALFDAVVVTANVNQGSKLESSISVSTLSSDAVEESAPRSTAEIFRNIPGVRSESTGGQGNANIAVRGLPVASGGAKFLQLHEDGLPVLEFGDIAFGNADIFLRNDPSLERVEAVRGGSASTYASNSPGGVINFISNVGSTPGGSIALTRGLDYRSTRLDVGYGSVAESWGFYLGGFYRAGEGVRRAGYTAEDGGQLKANLSRYFQNGVVRVYAKYLDDQAIGYLPMPVRVTGTNARPHLSGFSGFDPRRDTPHSVYFLRDFGLDGNNNPRVTNVAEGMHPISTAFGTELSFQLEGGWSILDRLRVADTSGRFVSPFPAEVGDAGAISASIGGAGSRLVYANGPQAGAGYAGRVIRTHLFNTEINDFGNAINDLQLAKAFGLSGKRNLNLLFGYYKSRQTINMDWTWNSYLLELKGDNAALLDVVDGTGAVVSRRGLYAYGVPFWGNCCQRNYDTDYDIDAPYAVVSFESSRLTLDASLRYDSGKAFGSYAGTLQVSDFDVDGDGTIGPPERSVSLIDKGRPSPVNYDWDYVSSSVGANVLFGRDLAGFARVSRGARANADRLLFGTVLPDGSVRQEDAVDFVSQIELGLKWRVRRLGLFVTGFKARTEEQNFEATTQRFFDRVYDSHGVELEVFSRFGDFSINGGLTWTDAEISKDQITPQNVGHTPRRQADFVYQATADYRRNRLNIGVNLIGTTDSFAQDNNELVMPGFTQVNPFVSVDMARRLTLWLAVNNLFDAFGLTESEEGTIVEGVENVIRARSIPGRSTTLTLRYRF